MDSSNFEGSFSQKIFTFIGIAPPPFIFAINITLYPFWAIRAIHSNPTIPPARSVKVEDGLRLSQRIEQLSVVFWGNST